MQPVAGGANCALTDSGSFHAGLRGRSVRTLGTHHRFGYIFMETVCFQYFVSLSRTAHFRQHRRFAWVPLLALVVERISSLQNPWKPVPPRLGRAGRRFLGRAPKRGRENTSGLQATRSPLPSLSSAVDGEQPQRTEVRALARCHWSFLPRAGGRPRSEETR